jgi:hypothetical protein
VTPVDAQRELHLTIGGITTALSWDDPSLDFSLDVSSQRFVSANCAADVAIHAAWDDLSRLADDEPVFDSGAVWRLSRTRTGYVYRFVSPMLGAVPYRTASLSPDFRSAQVRLHRPYFETRPTIYPLQYPLDELLLTNLLAASDGVELHACGIADGGEAGYIFAGHSGAGKTTLARLWAQDPAAEVISDDRVIVRREGGRYWMYGTPWHGEGEFASPRRVPLAAIFLIRHSPTTHILPVARAAAAARLFACSFPPFHSPEGLASILDLLDALVGTIPCHDLGVLPNPSIKGFVRSLRSPL